MKKELYDNILGKFEKLKHSIPYLEKAVKSRSVKQIENSIGYVAFLLHRLHKRATGQRSNQSIQEITKKIWWHKLEKDKDEKKYVEVNKQYQMWAKTYDKEAKETNIAIILENKEIKNFMPNVKNKDVLDFGCGTGRYAIPLAKKGANVSAIDFTLAMIKRAKEKAKKGKLKIDFKHTNLLNYSLNKKFDLIMSMLVLDHIKNLKKTVDIINKASKVGTEVIISNIHPEALRKDHDPKTGKAQGYLVEGFKTDQYYHPIEEYVDLFLKKGFVLTKIKEIAPTEKDLKPAKFKGARGLQDKIFVIIMKFEKVK